MLENFNPNDIALAGNNIFGLPTNFETADLIIIPMPWEVTVSYRNGTARAPEAIFVASKQIDLYDAAAHDMWKHGYFMEAVDAEAVEKNHSLRLKSESIIQKLEEGGTPCDTKLLKEMHAVNLATETIVKGLCDKATDYLNQNKLVAVVGGDHSAPLGLIKALAQKNKDFGILQIDAHFDFRKAYEGFTYSHASIMYNVLEQIPEVSKLVQVGIRDYCDEEFDYMQSQGERVHAFFDRDVKKRLYEGDTWQKICHEIVEALPQTVYISFDIDGLAPIHCANTGTPVSGGYEVEQIVYLFEKLVDSGRKIIGFDLVEVGCGENAKKDLDAIIAARILYKMSNLFLKSQQET